MTQFLMRLTLVRHGETEGQSSIRYHGRSDVPLSALGRAQMQRVRTALRPRVFARVYASRLSRAVEAAAIVGGAAHIEQIAGFDEIDFGAWEGLTAEEIAARDPEPYARWMLDKAEFVYPGGESTGAFRARVVRALHELLAAAPDGDLLLVVHKGVIRAVLTELLQPDDSQRHRLTVPLASIHVICRDNSRWRAEVLDRTDHL
jgi:broad specificity phosphatase PhoE